MYSRFLISLFAATSLLFATQSALANLVSGPMLGPVTMREATVWLQTETVSLVRIIYQAEGSSEPLRTPLTETEVSKLFAVSIPLTQVEPNTTYSYQVEIDGALTEAKGTFTTPAFYQERMPPPDLRIAILGAHYSVEEGFEPPYQTLGGDYGIFSKIKESAPDLNIWTGHTAYLRPSDWSSQSGYLKRYTQARSREEMAELLASTPNYATWGQADYGPKGAGSLYSNRQMAENSFRAFWPQASQANNLGLTSYFSLSDVDFFFLDTQSFRSDRPTANSLPTILGEQQIEWLRQEMIRSQATFKIVVAGAPILNPASNRENLSFAERELKQMLQMLRDEQIEGLFFISGGKAHGELTRLVHANTYNLYDLTLGPLTAQPEKSADELNYFRMPGTSSFQRHFGLIDITGPEENRALTIRVMNTEGQELWSQTIQANQLRANK